MGFIKAFAGALSQTFADQWKDYYLPQSGISSTTAVFRAVPKGTNNGVGENTKGAENIITNGSKIVVPEGTALITIQDGAITGCIAEAGGYEFKSDDPNSQSLFAGDGLIASTLKETWERVKFGGMPATQQLAFYVNLKEIPNNKFGTQSEIYWDDAFLQTQVGAVTRGTYSLKIVDPLLFVKNFVPAMYLQANAKTFDFADMDNDAATQLFGEVVGSLSAGFANYTNDPERGNRMAKIQGDQIGFAKSLSEAVEANYQWRSDRGLEIAKVAILAIEYDEESKKVMQEAQQDDRELRKERKHIAIESERGAAYSNNMAGMMASATGQAMVNASNNDNGTMMGFMGMNMAGQTGANVLGTVNNMQQQQSATADATNNAVPAEDPYAKLAQLKQLLDQGVITQADFDAAKNKLLGI